MKGLGLFRATSRLNRPDPTTPGPNAKRPGAGVLVFAPNAQSHCLYRNTNWAHLQRLWDSNMHRCDSAAARATHGRWRTGCCHGVHACLLAVGASSPAGQTSPSRIPASGRASHRRPVVIPAWWHPSCLPWAKLLLLSEGTAPLTGSPERLRQARLTRKPIAMGTVSHVCECAQRLFPEPGATTNNIAARKP